MIITKADVNDASSIATLAVQVWLDTYAVEGIRDSFTKYVWSELTPDNFRIRFSNPDREFLKVEINSHLVGFAEINYNSTPGKNSGTNVEIEKLYIQENFCNKGIGKKLIFSINERCKDKGILSVWLSVYENNERAISFYRKNNFFESGDLYFNLDGEKHRNLILIRKTT